MSAQTEYHVRRALKKAGPALPTHAAGTMLQANKLLLHFMPAARTFLVVLSHFAVCIISFATDEMIA